MRSQQHQLSSNTANHHHDQIMTSSRLHQPLSGRNLKNDEVNNSRSSRQPSATNSNAAGPDEDDRNNNNNNSSNSSYIGTLCNGRCFTSDDGHYHCEMHNNNNSNNSNHAGNSDPDHQHHVLFNRRESRISSSTMPSGEQPTASGTDVTLDAEQQSLKFQGKAKFKDAQPTLVLKRDFEIVHKALTMQQRRSSTISDISTGTTSILNSNINNERDITTSADCPTMIVDDLMMPTTATLASSSLPDTTTVTSDFIAWLDTPLASAPATIPPLLTFSKEEKGQPVTVVFYHQQEEQQDPQKQQLDNSTEIRKDSSRAITEDNLVINEYQIVPPASSSDDPLITSLFPSSPLKSSSVFSSPPTSTVTLKFSAGVCLVRKRIEGSETIPEVLVIRRSSEQFYELPKGHLEKGESLVQAACRELIEETGIKTPITIGTPLLSERYVVKKSATERLEKSVHYFRARLLSDSDASDVMFGEREEETKELKWMRLEEAKTAFWKSTAVRSVVLMALTTPEHD